MTVVEKERSGRNGGVDSGTSFSSKEVTPRDGLIEEDKAAGDQGQEANGDACAVGNGSPGL